MRNDIINKINLVNLLTSDKRSPLLHQAFVIATSLGLVIGNTYEIFSDARHPKIFQSISLLCIRLCMMHHILEFGIIGLIKNMSLGS